MARLADLLRARMATTGRTGAGLMSSRSGALARRKMASRNGTGRGGIGRAAIGQMRQQGRSRALAGFGGGGMSQGFPGVGGGQLQQRFLAGAGGGGGGLSAAKAEAARGMIGMTGGSRTDPYGGGTPAQKRLNYIYADYWNSPMAAAGMIPYDPWGGYPGDNYPYEGAQYVIGDQQLHPGSPILENDPAFTGQRSAGAGMQINEGYTDRDQVYFGPQPGQPGFNPDTYWGDRWY